ncbi:uncharacterized protein LOC101857556 [Aplysia californica]|uniref:Uncharacterized protein LOC101857556 n=1 Tax=Aplysia californica TaxID=6500 RepID=A0ABM0ZXE6_APLCA|nr:uncharacterized protein LOC101857556 [Aplysia californica]
MTASALYLPALSDRVPQLHNIVHSLEKDRHPSPVVKRASDRAFGSFYRMMARHNRYRDDQVFVEKMFRLFDMNSDQVIERDEFRAILQLLGIINHAY